MVVSAYCFWFQPDLPEPPYRIYEFTWVPVILCDFVANDCFCLLFQVAAWPKVKTRKKHIQSIMLSLSISCYFVAIGCNFLPPPTISCYFLLFPAISCYVMLFPAISCYRCVMLFPAASCYFLRFPAISC